MIQFNCPHCENAFNVPDELSGRDGWCRVCKRMIIIQAKGFPGPGLNDLPLEERYARLDKLMQYAAGRADNFKLLLSEYRGENGGLVSPESIQRYKEQSVSLSASLDNAEWQNKKLGEELTDVYKQRDTIETDRAELYLKLENSIAETRDANPGPTAKTLEEDLKEADMKIGALDSDLKEESAARGRVETDRDTLKNRIDQVQADLDAVSQARNNCEQLRNEMADTIDNLQGDLAAGEERIAVLCQEIFALKEEIETSRHVKEEVVSLTSELAELTLLEEKSRFDKETLMGQLAEMRAEANQLRQQIAALSARKPDVANAVPVPGKNGKNGKSSKNGKNGKNGANGNTSLAHTRIIEVAATPSTKSADEKETETLDDMKSPDSDSIMDSYLHFLESQ